MDFSRPWQSYAAGAALLACAVFFIMGPLQDTWSRALVFLGVLVLSIALSTWGFNSIRRRVLAEIAARKPEEGQA